MGKKKIAIPPTKKQIEFVEDMCEVLDIHNFPSFSGEFTLEAYQDFITRHYDNFYATKSMLKKKKEQEEYKKQQIKNRLEQKYNIAIDIDDLDFD